YVGLRAELNTVRCAPWAETPLTLFGTVRLRYPAGAPATVWGRVVFVLPVVLLAGSGLTLPPPPPPHPARGRAPVTARTATARSVFRRSIIGFAPWWSSPRRRWRRSD